MPDADTRSGGGSRRILLIGCPGAGKSTLATALGQRLALRVIHLDSLWWLAGWQESTPAEFDQKLAEVLALPEWIIDGNFIRTLPARVAAADLVIWLDFPRLLCLRRALWRAMLFYGRTRPDMTPGCPERIDLEFLRYIWSFQEKVRPRIEAALEAGNGTLQVVRVTSPRDAARFLSSM